MKRCVMLILSLVFMSTLALPQPADTLYIRTLSDKGVDYFKSGDLDAALKCYRKVCEAAPLMRDTARWSAALSSMGAIYRRKQMPDSCLACYQEALRLAEHTHDYAEQANLQSNIALCYLSAQKPDMAMTTSDKAVSAARRSGEMEAIMFAGYAGSSIYFRCGAYAKGIQVLHNLVEEAARQDKPQYMLRGYRIMLQMFDRRGMRDSVSHYMRAMDSTLNVMPAYTREAAMALEQQAIIYTKYRNFRKSLEVHQKLLNHQGGGNLTIDKIYLGMARNYYSLRDYLRAMKFYDRAVKTADSLYADKLKQQASDFQSHIKAQDEALLESESQQKALRQEIHTLRKALYIAIAIAGLVVTGLLWRMKKNRHGLHELK